MAVINLYNTASRAVTALYPQDHGMSVYVCGVTPYDTTHLGHAFTYVSFDVLIRYLRASGVAVKYAQNVTDIDDDILKRSKQLGIAYDELAERETLRYTQDMASLNVIPPDFFVPATTVMAEIVVAIRRLLELGFAYESGGNIYFRRALFPGYGNIAHLPESRLIMLAAEHGGFPDDRRKQDPLDFLLWQAHLPGEPEWPGPIESGRPGWHIECSTIATKYLPLPLDIHGGGRDLIFPHHASEIAEAESVTGSSPFVRCWMHTAMVRMDGEKMSKSLGNMVFLRDLLKTYSPAGIRLYLLSHRYRDEFEWSKQGLVVAEKMAQAFAALTPPESDDVPSGQVVQSLTDMLREDLDTPAVIDVLRQMIHKAGSGQLSDEETAALTWIGRVLGLSQTAQVPA